MKGQNFASQVLSRHTFRISRKKGSDFFDHRGTLMFDLFACEKFTGVTKGLGKARTLSGPVFFPAKWSVSVIAMFLVYKH